MFRLSKYLMGMWMGVNVVAVPLAFVLLFMFTGKVPVPGRGRRRLFDVEQALSEMRALVGRPAEEERHG